jgi:hypothetical protein
VTLVVEEVERCPETAYEYTAKANLVADEVHRRLAESG